MEIQSKELENYLESSLSAIRNGVEAGGGRVFNLIEFDLAVTNVQEGGGGLKIFVANAEGKLKSEEISHIKLKVQLKHMPLQQFSHLGLDPKNSAK